MVPIKMLPTLVEKQQQHDVITGIFVALKILFFFLMGKKVLRLSQLQLEEIKNRVRIKIFLINK